MRSGSILLEAHAQAPVPAGQDAGAAVASTLGWPEYEPDVDPLVDPATGLDGTRMWDRLLWRESHRLARHSYPVAIAAVELEGLKVVMDGRDRRATQRIEQALVDTLLRCARATDRVARIGDGRFGVLLVETDEAGAAAYGSRVAAASEPWLEAMPGTIRIRFGAASPTGHGTLQAAVAAAQARSRADREDRGSRRPMASPPTTIRTTGDWT